MRIGAFEVKGPIPELKQILPQLEAMYDVRVNSEEGGKCLSSHLTSRRSFGK
jgi:hypothetical protein